MHRGPCRRTRARRRDRAGCFICHGVDGESASPIFPRLAGQNEAYVVRQLRDYKTGKRVSSAMQPMVADLDDADFTALGAFMSHPTDV
ncbi:MAG: cytochrome c [Rubrivivax sp.]|nr:cytochrome c [Rubrivivax sp.]